MNLEEFKERILKAYPEATKTYKPAGVDTICVYKNKKLIGTFPFLLFSDIEGINEPINLIEDVWQDIPTSIKKLSVINHPNIGNGVYLGSEGACGRLYASVVYEDGRVLKTPTDALRYRDDLEFKLN